MTIQTASPNDTEQGEWVLTLVCADRPGIVHTVSGAVVAASGNIVELQQFSSSGDNGGGHGGGGRFFMRLHVETPVGEDVLRSHLGRAAEQLDADWTLDRVGRPIRTLVLASKAGHCLNDLLFRQRSGWLPVEIPLVLSNHPDLAPLAEFYGVPFADHVVLPETKADFEQLVLDAVEEHRIELVVLARYMQILSPSSAPRSRGARSTSTTRFCPGSREPIPIGRPMAGA